MATTLLLCSLVQTRAAAEAGGGQHGSISCILVLQLEAFFMPSKGPCDCPTVRVLNFAEVHS